MESEVNYPLLSDRAFMGRFEITMTYRQDATIWCPYLDAGTAAALRRPPQPKTAPSPVACFVSNRHTAWDREGYIRELMRYLAVDSYGRALSNRKLPENRGRETRLPVISRYKFTLAFENSICRDYVTEKFFEPLTCGSVPVYLGAPNVDEFAPADGCYINAADFSGPRDLAAYLKHLDRDDGAYGAYLRWKLGELRQSFLDKAELLRLSPFCRLCLRLYRDHAAAALKPPRPAAVDRALADRPDRLTPGSAESPGSACPSTGDPCPGPSARDLPSRT
jgi:hypothetical protein